MKPSTVLTKARKLIEKGWCKGPNAMDKRNQAVPFYSRKACRWCSNGAVNRSCRDFFAQEDAKLFLDAAAGDVRQGPWAHKFIAVNEGARDRRTVLRMFDRAIKLAKSEGQ